VGEITGVDIGTTSAKAARFAPDGSTGPVSHAGYPLREPHPGWAEQDPEQVVEAVVGLVPRGAPAALSSAMHSLVGVDAEGTPLTPLITWADTRATEQAERLRREHPHLHARTGTPLHPMAPLAKLCWLREHEPHTHADVARWCGIKELVLHRLTGEWVMDHSIASGTGLMALGTLDWDPEALELAGITPDRLPRLVPVTERLGDLVVGAGDGPLANLGVGAVRPGVAAVSIGTSGALRVIVEDPAVDERGRVFCYALTPGRWVVGGALNNGGIVLEWAGHAFGGADAETLLAEAAAVPPGSDGLLMLPYLLGERAPRWDAHGRGAYLGLTHAHGRGHLVRAALEGVCLQLALVLASVRDAGHEVRELRATGGFARSPLWRQMLADALGMPVGFPGGHQGSAFGAALVGMEAMGEIASIELAADLVTIDQVVEPDAGAAAVYARRLGVFDRLGAALPGDL
jgi:gluconokinase